MARYDRCRVCDYTYESDGSQGQVCDRVYSDGTVDTLCDKCHTEVIASMSDKRLDETGKDITYADKDGVVSDLDQVDEDPFPYFTEDLDD